MTTCCGKKRSTSYCSDCGKRLHADTSLARLIFHLRRQAKYFKRRAQSPQAAGDSRNYEDRIRIADKWQRWADEVAKLSAAPEPNERLLEAAKGTVREIDGFLEKGLPFPELMTKMTKEDCGSRRWWEEVHNDLAKAIQVTIDAEM